jgi:UDPglucose 6-dehydrogenase
MSNNFIIGFAGLTHLGIISAVAAASKGFKVIGYHDDKTLIESINNDILPIEEPGLKELLDKHRHQLIFHDTPSALVDCDLVYISADVPTNDSGESDLTLIRKIVDNVITVIKKNALLVILCQVPPGFTRSLSLDYGRLYYQVETLIFGRAVERALYPERFIVGCVDPGLPLPEQLEFFLRSFGCPILPMRYESAELAKISINMCLVASVSVANVMAEICEHIGADWSEIVPALRLDQRIGKYSYINPGLGISGGNLERDLATVLRLSETHGTQGAMVSEWLSNSRHRKNWPFETLKRMVLIEKPTASIALLGLAYKENTHSTKNSPALILLEQLSSCKVAVYDPVVPVPVVEDHVIRAASALDAVNGADALVIMTPWSEFRELTAGSLAQRMAGRLVIDPYRVLDGKSLRMQGFTYATLGAPLER